MTGIPARRLGLKDRGGMIKEGYYADIVIFDPERIADRATYLEPTLYPPDGIEYVIVNGKITIRNGYEIGTRNGKVLWRNEHKLT
ncbi:amidohydrolase family protein [Vulcanisaeta souniana]|uniref:amidohydrolase family protein n=1 Tax=Vulcanisaeta souniana TaxID=164452 RepID=UPI0006D024D7|nr:amidohydrolase family protein [Vulcanisaeta souniana]